MPLVLLNPLPATHILLFFLFFRQYFNSNPKVSKTSCCAHRSSTVYVVLCVMLSCSILRRRGRRHWNISNAPTCLSFPWTMSDAGIVIIIFLPSCYGNDCMRVLFLWKWGTRGGLWRSYIFVPACGTKIM